MNRLFARLFRGENRPRRATRRQVPTVRDLESRALLTAIPGIDPGQYQTIAQAMNFGQLAGGTSVSQAIQGFNRQVGTLTEVDVINSGVVAGGASGSLTLTGPSVSNTANLSAGGGAQMTVITAPGDLAPFLNRNWLTYSEAAQGAAGAQATVQVIYRFVPASVMPPNNPSAGPLDTSSPVASPTAAIAPADSAPVSVPIPAGNLTPVAAASGAVWTGLPTEPSMGGIPTSASPDYSAYSTPSYATYTPATTSLGKLKTLAKRGGRVMKHAVARMPVYHPRRGH